MVSMSLEKLLEGNFFNFLLLFILVAWAFVKCDVSGKISAAKDAVAEYIRQSELKKEETEKNLETVQKEMAELPNQLNQILKDAETTVEGYKAKTETEIKELSERLEHNANKIIDSEVKKASAELSKDLVRTSIDTAKDKIVNSLAQNNSIHRTFITKAINSIDELNI